MEARQQLTWHWLPLTKLSSRPGPEPWKRSFRHPDSHKWACFPRGDQIILNKHEECKLEFFPTEMSQDTSPSEDLEENTNYVTASILQAAKLSSPAPKVYLQRPPAPFWNENCRLAIKERNRKRNIFRRNRTEESFENYKRAKGRAQWVVKNAKKECWQSFCSRLNRNTDLGTLWRTIKSMNGTILNSQIPPIASESGIPLDNLGKADTLADTFALASSNANCPRISHKSKIIEDGAICLYRPCSLRFARRLVLEALPLVDQRRCTDLTGDSIESSPIGRLAKPLRLDWELSDWLANGATPLVNETD